MSLKEQAQTIRNETQAGANTAERIGQYMEENAEVSETVDTIADLRAFDTTQLSDGDVVRVNAHNANGLYRNLGAGLFKWKTAPLFSINQTGGITTGSNSGTTVTPTTTGFALPALGTYVEQLPKLIFGDGTTARLDQTDSQAGDRDLPLAEGITTLDIDADGAVADGQNAYRQDDGGVWIRPNYTGFDGEGYFEKILVDNFVTPEDYGAIPNFSFKDGAINECSSEIQSAFDSPWNVRMKGGAYYIDTPIIAQRGKTVEMSPTYYTESTFEDNRRTKLYDKSVSSIYITTNIDVIVVRCTDLKWFYGEIDTRNANSTCDKAAFRFDMSANLAFCDIKEPKVTGNESWLQAGDNNGITALLVDIENMITNSGVPNTRGIGSMYYQYIDIIAEYCHTCYWVNGKPIDNTQNYYTNSVVVNMISLRNKRAIYMESSQGSSSFTGFHQTSYVLTANQKDMPVSTLIGESYFDIFAFDLGSLESNGNYRNSKASDFSRGNTYLGPYAAKQGHNSNYLAKDSIQSSQFGDKVGTYDSLQVSRLDNGLALINRRGGNVSVGAYNAAGGDLTTALTSASSQNLPVASNVTITDSGHLFSVSDKSGTEVSFSTGADLDNDFVEIEVTNCDPALWTEEVRIAMRWFNQLCDKIQVITGKVGDLGQQTIDVTGAFSSNYRGDRLYTFGDSSLQLGFSEDVLRIRLIGINELGSYTISEIITTSSSAPYYPYIHTGGGQSILGPLEVEKLEYTKDTSLGDNRTAIKGLDTDKFRLIRPVTSAEILSLNSSPITLVSEEDADALTDDFGNPAVIPIRAYIKSVSGSTDYATNTNLIIRDNNSTAGKKLELSISSINDGYVYSFSKVGNALHRRYNGGIKLSVETGNPTGGDKSFELVVEFEIVL